MMTCHGSVKFCAGFILLLGMASPAPAARVRYHYGPADDSGNMCIMPDGPFGNGGESVAWFGLVRRVAPPPPRPTYRLTFRHPYSNRMVRVPVSLPEETPRIAYRTHWVIYNYGSYLVEIHFLPDGTVDVIYNSGIRRPV